MVLPFFRILEFLTEPSTALSVAVLAGAVALIAGWRRTMLVCQAAAVAEIVLLGILPGGYWLTLPLEKRFSSTPDLPADVAGIVVLGGTERLPETATWGRPTFSDSAPIAVLIALARRYPEAKLVFTGGVSHGTKASLTEGQVVRQFLDEMGIPRDRIMFEERSRDTRENAIFTRDLVHPGDQEQWLLVAQAISLPRAVLVFRHAGWNVIPVPASYLTDSKDPSWPSFHLLGGLRLASTALHEWGGLLVYRIEGYTDALFP